MLNITFNDDRTWLGTSFTIATVALASFIIVLDISIFLRLLYYRKHSKGTSTSFSRSVGLMHSINTYIHLLGNTTVFLLMSSRTLVGDGSKLSDKLILASWHCRLLNCSMAMFSAGIYGSCFLQALFRFWRITQSSQSRLTNYAFHCQLIVFHWLWIGLLAVPVWFRSVYVVEENYCFNPFIDPWSSVYISSTSVGIPLVALILIYVKIVLFIKRNSRAPRRWRRIQRDVNIIRRILVLVLVLLCTSSGVVILWISVYVQKRMHPLSYRWFCFMIVIGMLVCSVTLVLVSPQLRRALRSLRQHSKSPLPTPPVPPPVRSQPTKSHSPPKRMISEELVSLATDVSF